jgi:sec-independent protein translocase protein TatC
MRRLAADTSDMPFLEHLEELRWRIIWSLVAIALGVAAGFYIALHFDIVKLLEAPILPYLSGKHVVATHPTDGLQITMSASIWIGVVLAFPFVVYQAWLFLLPALYPRERSLLIAALVGGMLLFAAGALFAYWVVLPMSLPWLFGFFGTALDPMITAESYFGFVFGLVLSFVLAFELPVVVLLLAAAGLVKPELLTKVRRHAIVVIVSAAAFLTPGGDPMSTIALALPLYVLYELSVLVARVIWRHRAKDASVAILLAPLVLLRQIAKLRGRSVAVS